MLVRRRPTTRNSACAQDTRGGTGRRRRRRRVRAFSQSIVCAHMHSSPQQTSAVANAHTHTAHALTLRPTGRHCVTYRAICDVVLVHETKTIVVFVAMVVVGQQRRRAQFEQKQHRLVDATIARASVAWLPSWHRLVDRRDCDAIEWSIQQQQQQQQQQQRDRRKQQQRLPGTSRTPKQSIVPS
jgi:hypothetical protein